MNSRFPFFTVSTLIVFWLCCCSDRPKSSTYVEIRKRIELNFKLGHYQDALHGCDTLIGLDSTDSWAYEQKASTLFELKQCEEAIAVLNRGLEFDHQRSGSYFLRGNLYQFLGDTTKAINDYCSAIQYNPKALNALNNRASLYRSQRKVDSAIADLKAIINSDSSYVVAWGNLGSIYSDLGYLDSSVYFYSRGINVQATEACYNGRAQTYYKMHESEKSISDYTEAIRLNPKNSLNYLYRAYAYADLGKNSEMCEDFKSSWNLGNMEAARYYQLNCVK